MSFKPNLQALHDCIHYMAATRTPKESSPSKIDPKRDFFKSIDLQKKNAEDLFKKVPIRPSTAVANRVSLRNQNSSITKIKQKLSLMSSEAESFLNKTNRDVNQSNRSDAPEMEEKGIFLIVSHLKCSGEAKTLRLTSNLLLKAHEKEDSPKISFFRSAHKPRPISVNAQLNIESREEELSAAQDLLNEKIQNNYHHFRKTTAKLWARPFEKYEEKMSNLLGKSPIPTFDFNQKPLSSKNEEAKSFFSNDSAAENSPNLETPKRLSHGFRKQDHNRKSDKDLNATARSTVRSASTNKKPCKVFLLPPEEPQINLQNISIEPTSSPKRSHRKIRKMASRPLTPQTDLELSKVAQKFLDSPDKTLLTTPKDIKNSRIRNIKNYIVQKRNLQIQNANLKEIFSHRSFMSGHIQTPIIITQDMFNTSIQGSPVTHLHSNRWLRNSFDSDVVSKSLVLATPTTKRRPKLQSQRPETTPTKTRNARSKNKKLSLDDSSQKNKDKNSSQHLSPWPDNDPVGKGTGIQILPKDIENFEIEGWGQETNGSLVNLQ